MKSSVIFVLFLASSLHAQEMSSMDLQCRAEAKEIALKSYQACIASAKAARLDQIRREYQQKLAEVKKQYEAQLQELKSKPIPQPTPAATPSQAPKTSSAAPAPSASIVPNSKHQDSSAPVTTPLKAAPIPSKSQDEMVVVMKPASSSPSKTVTTLVPTTQNENVDQEEGDLELVDPSQYETH